VPSSQDDNSVPDSVREISRPVWMQSWWTDCYRRQRMAVHTSYLNNVQYGSRGFFLSYVSF
jgi:hypothetical protein